MAKAARDLKIKTFFIFFYYDLQHPHLQFSTVTLLSLLHIAVATFLPTIQHFDLWHIEETHSNAFFETSREVLPAAAAEHRRKRIPASEGNVT